MNVLPVNLVVAVLVAGLVTLGISRIASSDQILLISVGCFVSLSSTLVAAIGVGFENAKAGVNIRLAAVIFFILMLAMQLLFCFVSLSAVSYVVSAGIVFLVFVLVAQSICRATQ